jgi:hypothetical protein
MPGLTYTTYVNQIATMAVVEPTDPAFVTIIPSMIDYAELRIYRELDLLSTVTPNTTYSMTANNRNFSWPQGTFVTIQDINVITPAGTTNPELGTRVQLLPTTKEFLNVVYANSTNAGVPSYFAMLDDHSVVLGPWPDSGYRVEIVGTVRPAPLSVGNPTTFISEYLPDLLIMASMVYVSAYQRNFGRESDDPQMAQSYEAQYKELRQSALLEEFRKKFQASAWSSFTPSPVATPTRG